MATITATIPGVPDTNDLDPGAIALIEAFLARHAESDGTFREWGARRAMPCQCLEGPMLAWTQPGEPHCVRCGHDQEIHTC
jgi:hypothetical protein